MKKTITLLLTLVLCLSLCACGDGKAEAEGKPTESSELKVGDTAKGQLFDVTIQSVEPVEKIENGFVRHMWSPAEKTNYQDITAEEGYSIVKITYSYSYNGKEAGEFGFDLTLDYDNGYMFDGFGGHVLPTIDSGAKVGFEEYYDTGVLGSFAVDDPLTFKGAEAFKYIIVNNEVLSNIDKPLVLKVGIPSSAWDWTPDGFGNYVLGPQSEPETFTFNLR